MKHGKTMGPDRIPVEVWKSLGQEGVDTLLDLLHMILEQEKMPEEWRGGVIVPIFLISKLGSGRHAAGETMCMH